MTAVDATPAARGAAAWDGAAGTQPQAALAAPQDLGARLVEWLDPPHDFNFRHFRMRHMAAELLHSVRADGVPPGRDAPDFDLETTTGGRLRLRDLRGRPVLLHFVSYTCPVTRGTVRPMRELHRLYGDRVQFVDLVVRQAHPGERHGGYTSYAQKLEDGQRYRDEEAIEWPVVIDDLECTTQRAYGGLAAAAYLIDAEGRVAFSAIWGQAPPLRVALNDLLARGGSGTPVGQGIDRVPHLAAAIVAGHGGPWRGGLRSVVDLELGFPGAFLLMAIGFAGRPVLAPLVLRTAPLPLRARGVLLAGLTGGGLALGWAVRRLRRHSPPSGTTGTGTTPPSARGRRRRS